jgi:aconitase B
MAQQRKRTIAERLQENEEIMRELLAEGYSEREARKLLVPRALEKYLQNQVLEDILGVEEDESDSPAPDDDE